MSYRYVDENNSFILYSNLSVGLLSFQDIGKIVDPWEISGTALGQGATLGVEYFIDYGLAVGIQLSGVRSILKKYEIYDGTGRFTVNEARHDKMIYLFDLSAGLRYIR
ncbi:MAG: hypothetical protein IH948_08995 [Bacteroidetes bacterium]|nr:hypothetical protein [Bacteroidota bacterium]